MTSQPPQPIQPAVTAVTDVTGDRPSSPQRIHRTEYNAGCHLGVRLPYRNHTHSLRGTAVSAMSDLDTDVRDLAKVHHREARDDIDRYDVLAMVDIPILYAHARIGDQIWALYWDTRNRLQGK